MSRIVLSCIIMILLMSTNIIGQILPDKLPIVNNNLNMKNGVNVIIINTLGQMVYNQVINIDKINTSMFSSGIYFVKVIDSTTNQEFFDKFIK